MRCYFMRDGHIQDVEELFDLSDQEAITKGRALYEEHKTKFSYDGFEVWDLARIVFQYPMPRPASVAESEDAAPS
jgi:hypothetical protein